jgi:hypothetical protein
MSQQHAALDTAERVLRVIREAFIVLAIGVLLWIFAPRLPEIAAQIKAGKLTSVEAFGLKLDLNDVQSKLQQAVRAEAPMTGREDQPASEQTRLVASALQQIREAARAAPAAGSAPPAAAAEAQTGWIYLGASRDERWVLRNFDGDRSPDAGDVIRPSADMYWRRSLPRERGDQWTMGEVLDVVPAGTPLEVVSIEGLPGTQNRTLWWAEVKRSVRS